MLGYKKIYKYSNHQESFRTMSINYKNLEKQILECNHYLRFTDCIHDAVRQNEDLQDMPRQQKREAYFGMPIYQPTSEYDK